MVSPVFERDVPGDQQFPHCVLWHCGAVGTWWERNKEGVWTFIVQKGARPIRSPTKGRGAWMGRHQLHSASPSVAEGIGGWDEQCRWLEDWDFFLRIYLRYPGQVQHVPEILVEIDSTWRRCGWYLRRGP